MNFPAELGCRHLETLSEAGTNVVDPSHQHPNLREVLKARLSK